MRACVHTHTSARDSVLVQVYHLPEIKFKRVAGKCNFKMDMDAVVR